MIVFKDFLLEIKKIWFFLCVFGFSNDCLKLFFLFFIYFGFHFYYKKIFLMFSKEHFNKNENFLEFFFSVFLLSKLPFFVYRLTYLDDENDLDTIGPLEEFHEAMSVGDGHLKVKIEHRGKPIVAKEEKKENSSMPLVKLQHPSLKCRRGHALVRTTVT